MEMRWRPIETAPKDKINILVFCKESKRELTSVARWDRNLRGSGFYGEFGWMRLGYQNIAAEAISPPPTHWMPLPDAPNE